MPSGLASSDTRRRWLLLGGWLAAWAALAWWRWSREPYLLDDAFISFRYARNLVEGHGLVYNPGERVEGYTNPALDPVRRRLPSPRHRSPDGNAHAGRRLVSGRAPSPSPGWWCGIPLPRPLWKQLGLALAPLALILPAGYAGFAGTGMETSFVGLLGLARRRGGASSRRRARAATGRSSRR